MGKRDPAAALKIARTVTGERRRSMALAIAAKYQSIDAARKLYTEAVLSLPEGMDHPDHIARIASIAFEQDKALGKQVYAEAVKKLDTKQGLEGFAFYYARVNPVESKRILEAELANDHANPDTQNPF